MRCFHTHTHTHTHTHGVCFQHTGDAVLFYNLAGMHGQSGAVDSSSWHSGCEVRGGGTKRAVNIWFFTGLPEKCVPWLFARAVLRAHR